MCSKSTLNSNHFLQSIALYFPSMIRRKKNCAFDEKPPLRHLKRVYKSGAYNEMLFPRLPLIAHCNTFSEIKSEHRLMNDGMDALLICELNLKKINFFFLC